MKKYFVRRRNISELPAGEALAVLAVPMTLQAALSAAVLLVDIFFVSRLGTDAVSAVGWIGGLLTCLAVIVNGVGMAATTYIANSQASRDPAQRAAALARVIVTMVLLSAFIPAAGWIAYEPFLRAFGAPESVIAFGRPYAAWTVLGYPSVLALFVFNCVLRGAGRPGLALNAMVIACLLNALLNPILIFGLGPVPAFGLAGAGAASVLGRAGGVIYQIRQLARASEDVLPRLSLADFRMSPRDLLRLLSMSAGGILQSVVTLAGSLFVLRYVASFGPAAVAGYIVSARLLAFIALPVNGLSTAAAVLVGQHVPAGRRRIAVRAVHLALAAASVISIIVAAGLLGFPALFVGLFDLEPQAAGVAAVYLRISAVFLLAMSGGAVLVHVLNGIGRLRQAAVIHAVALVAVQLPLTFLLANGFGLGPAGIFLALGFGQMATLVISLVAVRRSLSRRVLHPGVLHHAGRAARAG